MRLIDARVATAAGLLFSYAAFWLIILSLAGWLAMPAWLFAALFATQVAWIIGVGLLAGWRWARWAALLYVGFGLALGAWSVWNGVTGDYDSDDWVFTAIVAVVPLLIGGLLLTAANPTGAAD